MAKQNPLYAYRMLYGVIQVHLICLWSLKQNSRQINKGSFKYHDMNVAGSNMIALASIMTSSLGMLIDVIAQCMMCLLSNFDDASMKLRKPKQ